VQRLDALQVAAWDKAMDGDVKAILAALRSSRLLGLEKPGAWKAEPETVVLGPDQLAGRKKRKSGISNWDCSRPLTHVTVLADFPPSCSAQFRGRAIRRSLWR